ncbi:FadR family transcriptional regulator [Propioniciclava coleopterorum]|uniref:FadR family transcriptional regulator n=1 Tax=Propioniciclava coleopterorum TaxID=2714937 RepID=A0A6G7Y7E7_9ACTN|nr:FCD domain-containing protein [Propioniciclava coleopterorum]QIK72713.1 FadR family transcriptional regulator [Propioniciclava coleopterorum]
MPAPVAYQHVLEVLGLAIASDEVGASSIILIEEVEARFAVSRSVAREALRILESLGMVAMKRRVGCIVQPRAGWSVTDPRVIHWRISGPHRVQELDQLMQLRAGVEPIAARLAAGSARTVGLVLLEHAEEMRSLASQERGHTAEFLAADVAFHKALLTGSGNDHFAAMGEVVAAVLTERNRLGLLEPKPDPRAVQMHVRIATAILEGRIELAEASARGLVDVVAAEVLMAGGLEVVAGG